MNRIKAEEVIEAYRTTGLEPEPTWYNWIDGRECSCGLGVVAIHRGYDKGKLVEELLTTEEAPDNVVKFLNLEDDYVKGFIDAFDGCQEWEEGDPEDLYHLGLKDGQEASFQAMAYSQTL